MSVTPLEAWLEARQLSVHEAREICVKKRCAGGFDTLLLHPYTLPKLACAVARALHIPAEAAAPMGRPVDGKAWRAVPGISRLDSINANPQWWAALGSAEDEKETPTWLDVVNLRRLLSDRGINWLTWQREHNHLYTNARGLTVSPETRLRHIGDLAAVLEVPTEQLLTLVPDIDGQFRAHGCDKIKPVNDGLAIDQRVSRYCRLDVDAIERERISHGLSEAEAAKRHTQAVGRTEGGYTHLWRACLTSARQSAISLWLTAERFAETIGCEPEAIARRLGMAEYNAILEERRRAAAENDT